jgi:hypothetical protein
MYLVRLSYILLKVASGNGADGIRARVGYRWGKEADSITSSATGPPLYDLYRGQKEPGQG